MGESGGSAERKAEELRAQGKRSAGAWAAGADGERRVAAALAALPPEWLVLHDRLLMPGLAESNLDHLLVGPAGIVLVDAKNWAGQIGEWEGTVFQLSTGPGGERRHRPVDREFAGVRAMATEITRRVGLGVTVVICLAGRQAEQFGEPRVVKDVWVVPIDHLVGWLTARPHVEFDDRQRLDVLVRTEFPSTTTDPGLLLAMGRQLKVPRASLNRAAIRRLQGYGQPAPQSRSDLPSPSRRTKRRQPPRRRRRSGFGRFLLGMTVAVAMLVAVQNGALTVASEAIASALADAVTQPSTVGSASPTTRTPSPGTSAAPAKKAVAGSQRVRLSCDAFDPRDHAQLAKLTLKASETVTGCDWTVPAKPGKSAIRVVRMAEDISPSGLDPMFKRSANNKAPVMTRGWDRDGWYTAVWVAKGTRLASGTKTVTTTRNVRVIVAHEFLGLSAKQGRTLALAIARTAGTRPAAKTG
jgi:hypothetical protein